jgi:hypothetical protein
MILMRKGSMRKGFDMGPMFWIILGVLFMIGIIIVIINVKDGSLDVINKIFGGR